MLPDISNIFIIAFQVNVELGKRNENLKADYARVIEKISNISISYEDLLNNFEELVGRHGDYINWFNFFML